MKKEEGIWVSEGEPGKEREGASDEKKNGERKEEGREGEGGQWKRPRKENHSSWRTESVGAKLTQHGRETDNVGRPFSFILPLYNPFSLSTPAVVKSFIAISSPPVLSFTPKYSLAFISTFVLIYFLIFISCY